MRAVSNWSAPAMQYPPDDASAARADAAKALLDAIREVRDANERLQFAAAYVLEAFGDRADAETIRMLPVGGSSRPGKPAVPPPAPSAHLTDDLSPRAADALADLVALDRDLREGPDSVTVTQRPDVCDFCGHTRGLHTLDSGCTHPVCDCAYYVEPEL